MTIIKAPIFVFGVLIFVLMAIPVVAFDVVTALIDIAIYDLKMATALSPQFSYDCQEGK